MKGIITFTFFFNPSKPSNLPEIQLVLAARVGLRSVFSKILDLWVVLTPFSLLKYLRLCASEETPLLT